MTSVLMIAMLFAQVVLPGLDQIRADVNPERRAKLAVDFAAAAEKNAEAAYSSGDMAAVIAALKNMVAGMELAKEALDQTGKTANRNPGPFKAVELKSQAILERLGDLEKRMDSEERSVLDAARNRVQEIHDAWFDGIMSKKK